MELALYKLLCYVMLCYIFAIAVEFVSRAMLQCLLHCVCNIAYSKVSISDTKLLTGRESGFCVSLAGVGRVSPIL